MSNLGSSSYGHIGSKELVVDQSENDKHHENNKILSTHDNSFIQNEEHRGKVFISLSSQGDSMGLEFNQVQRNKEK